MAGTALAPEVPSPLVLEASELAPSLAREFLGARFAEWGIEDDYLGRLVVSELVTNSVTHGEGAIIVRVFLDVGDARPVVEVWDAGEGRPVVRPEDHAKTSGRGLLLVAELVHEWGVRACDEGGKVTWAKLR